MLIMIAGELGKYTASHKRLCDASAAHVALVVFDDMCTTSLLCTQTADLEQLHVYFMNELANAIPDARSGGDNLKTRLGITRVTTIGATLHARTQVATNRLQR